MSVISQTRDWVNSLRRDALGLRTLDRMPRGIMNSEANCPIARALVADLKPVPGTYLEVSVDGEVASVYRYSDVRTDEEGYDFDDEPELLISETLPEFAKEFVKMFDEGRIEKLQEV